MFSIFKRTKKNSIELLDSQLFDEQKFYKVFLNDIEHAKKEVIIESPFITKNRANMLIPNLKNLVQKGIKVFVITRDPEKHDEVLARQAEKIICFFEAIGVQVFLSTGNPHRKLAIIDREILWEGSLNILSQTKSREIMRRTQSKRLALEMFTFANYKKCI